MTLRYKHHAIFKLYPNVRQVMGDDAFDSSGNLVTYDETTVMAEAKLMDLRAERNGRLAETDWWASSDLTMTAEQTAYRQALRDITNTATSLDDVVWPEKPE